MTINANSGRILFKTPVRMAVLVLMFATGALLLFAAQSTHETMAAQQTINLNTGFDQVASSVIAVPGVDDDWIVTVDAGVGGPTPPRQADVVDDPGWHGATCDLTLEPTHVNSKWISVTPNQGKPLPAAGPVLTFVVKFDFTLPVGFSSPALTADLCADDLVTQVDVNSCTLFGPGGVGGNFAGSPLPVATSNPACFQAGLNTLTVTFQDTFRQITGLLVEGTVTYELACITIEKITDPPGGTGFMFPWTGTTDPPNSVVIDAPFGFPLSHGDSSQICPLLPGIYSFFESVPTGWSVTNIVCVGGSGITFLNSGSSNFTPGDIGVTIDLDAGQNVTCTFTNSTLAVGGIVELPGDADTLAEASDSSTRDYTAPIAAVAAAVVALAAAGWYARRRLS